MSSAKHYWLDMRAPCTPQLPLAVIEYRRPVQDQANWNLTLDSAGMEPHDQLKIYWLLREEESVFFMEFFK